MKRMVVFMAVVLTYALMARFAFETTYTTIESFLAIISAAAVTWVIVGADEE